MVFICLIHLLNMLCLIDSKFTSWKKKIHMRNVNQSYTVFHVGQTPVYSGNNVPTLSPFKKTYICENKDIVFLQVFLYNKNID